MTKIFGSISRTSRAAVLFCAAVVVSTGLASVSHATPGDALCTGKTADGRSVEVLLGYENFDQETASFIEVSLDENKIAIFPKETIRVGYADFSTTGEPVLMFFQAAEQGADRLNLVYFGTSSASGETAVLLDLKIPAVPGKANSKEILIKTILACQP